jgi:GNAT superfamily N-acetyltransferase
VGSAIEIRRLPQLGEPEVSGLAEVLNDCVHGGASVSFMLPMSPAKAAAYWRGVAAQVATGESLVLAAFDEAVIVGTVTLILRQPENQPHRADLAKMLVHRRARCRGVGAALLQAAEQEALGAGRTLLVLDTASADAERVYARGGWQRLGEIPDFALWPAGGYCATTVFYKQLRRAP